MTVDEKMDPFKWFRTLAWRLVFWWEVVFAPDDFLFWISDVSSDDGLEFSKWPIVRTIDFRPSAWASVRTVGVAWTVVRACDGLIVAFHCAFIITL